MTEKGEAEGGVAADTVEAVFSNIGNVADRIGAQVAKFRRFEVAPDVFDGIEVWRVTRQSFDAQPIALAGDPVQHAPAAMRGQPVPDQQHATLLDVVHVGQELNQRLVVVGARTQLEDEVRIATIGFVRQSTGQR